MRAASKEAEAEEGWEMVNLGLVDIVMVVVVLVDEPMVVGGLGGSVALVVIGRGAVR